jgi:hypothetical protein
MIVKLGVGATVLVVPSTLGQRGRLLSRSLPDPCNPCWLMEQWDSYGAPHGHVLRVFRVTITSGKIVNADIVADPARLRELHLTALDELSKCWADGSRSRPNKVLERLQLASVKLPAPKGRYPQERRSECPSKVAPETIDRRDGQPCRLR